MEKLRELLNEFDPYIQKDGEHRDNLWYGVICGESAVYWKEIGVLKIISKEYGFIEWLIDKDKIHCGKVIGEYGKTVGAKFISEPIQYNDFVSICLMLLSIQEDPIGFLISILK